MGITGYFGPADLRVKAGDLLKGVTEVMDGRLPVEEAAGVPQREGYGTVGDYDPVLRAHCRLDKEG